jgi:hypothetical protein
MPGWSVDRERATLAAIIPPLRHALIERENADE